MQFKHKPRKPSLPTAPCFRNLAPKTEAIGSLRTSAHTIKYILDVVSIVKTQNKGDHDEKTMVRKLDMELGTGIMSPAVLRLAVRLARLSLKLKDGKSVRNLSEYLMRRLATAEYYEALCGRELLEYVADGVMADLRDYKSGAAPRNRLK